MTEAGSQDGSLTNQARLPLGDGLVSSAFASLPERGCGGFDARNSLTSRHRRALGVTSVVTPRAWVGNVVKSASRRGSCCRSCWGGGDRGVVGGLLCRPLRRLAGFVGGIGVRMVVATAPAHVTGRFRSLTFGGFRGFVGRIVVAGVGGGSAF